VLRATGLKGEIRIELFRPRREATTTGHILLEKGDGTREAHQLMHTRFVDPIHAVVTFAAIRDRDDAESISGAGMIVDLDRKDSALVDDADRLLHLLAIDAESGRILGTITDIQDNGAQAILAITPSEGGAEKLVPFVPAFVEGVDGDRVTIRTIPGLVD
jgi:16S rRNA processing protein RimM